MLVQTFGRIWSLVDEFQMMVCPVVVGGGKRFFQDSVRSDLELVQERAFRNGVVGLRYGRPPLNATGRKEASRHAVDSHHANPTGQVPRAAPAGCGGLDRASPGPTWV